MSVSGAYSGCPFCNSNVPNVPRLNGLGTRSPFSGKRVDFCRQTSRRSGILSPMHTIPVTDGLRPQTERDEVRLREAGFRWGQRGTHTSRTIMLDELRSLLSACRADATRDEYLSAIRDDNCLSKRTAATRRLSSQRLSELYALDPEVPLFAIMRRCWYADTDSQAILALLLALARDPLLRITAPPILLMRPGEELARQQLTDALRREVRSRLSDSTLDKVVRNAASSWTQSGHFEGRGRKRRWMARRRGRRRDGSRRGRERRGPPGGCRRRTRPSHTHKGLHQ